MIYLDNAATTKIHPKVVDAMLPYLTEKYGNAGSLHRLGRESATAVAKARGQVAELIGATPENIIFTSGGSEANNLMFKGLESYLKSINKTHIITSIIEHDSVIHATEALIKRQFDVTYIPVDKNCRVSVDSIREAMREDTGLVSIMYVNNETGIEQPIKDIAKICQEKGILFATDCVQAVGFQDINVDGIGCDFLSISGHKIHAPKGIGALYVRDKTLLQPIISGGGMQEFGLRGGTENVAGIVGFGKACELLKDTLVDDKNYINLLKTKFIIRLGTSLAGNDIEDILKINGKGESGKIINIRFEGIEAQALMLMMENREIYLSAGSACRSQELTPSRVLKSMGLKDNETYESVRISFSTENTIEEVEKAAESLVADILILKELG